MMSGDPNMGVSVDASAGLEVLNEEANQLLVVPQRDAPGILSPGLEITTKTEQAELDARALSDANAQQQRAQAVMLRSQAAAAVEKAEEPYGKAFGLSLDDVLSVLVASSMAHAARSRNHTLKDKEQSDKQARIDELTAKMETLTADAQNAMAQAAADAERIGELEADLADQERVNGLAQAAVEAARTAQEAQNTLNERKRAKISQ